MDLSEETVQSLISALQSIGLTLGTPEFLQAYENERERQERFQERALKKEEMELQNTREREKEKLEREKEQLEREREREKEQLEREREILNHEREREREQFELKRLKLEARSRPETPVATVTNRPIKFPDLQRFNTGEDILLCLDRYRVQYEVRKYTEEEACILPQQLLPSNLVDVIERMPSDERIKFDLVSKNLITAAGYKPEDFCNQYYRAHPDEFDNAYRYILRQQRNFRLWCRSRNVKEKDYTSLENFIILEQFIQYLPPSMAVEVRKEYKGDLLELAKHLDTYISIHHPRENLNNPEIHQEEGQWIQQRYEKGCG